MKKLYVFAAALLMTGALAQAQELSFGAGYLNSTLTGKYNGSQQNDEAANGIFLGGTFNLPIAGELKLAPGLYYSFLFGKGNGSYLNGAATGSVTFAEHAINVPVYLNYGMNLDQVDLFIFGGPTFQYGLSSTYKVEGKLSAFGINLKTGGTIDNYKDKDMSPFNIYMGGGLGADFNKMIRVTLGFDYGLLNLYKGDTADTQYNRYNFKLGVAYLF